MTLEAKEGIWYCMTHENAKLFTTSKSIQMDTRYSSTPDMYPFFANHNRLIEEQQLMEARFMQY
jgi:hypothetical protein